MSEREMLDLLLSRYTAIREGTIADRWVRAEHVSSNLGYGKKRVADFIAADRYPAGGLAFHGHEVKVSRSDWLAELRDPAKSAAFKRHMNHWWLVVPDAGIVKAGELPMDWGLLVVSRGKLRAKVKAPKLAPEPMPAELAISLMAAAARTAHREPLRRDAPIAHITDWTPRCGFCGEVGPCRIHQHRALAAESS